MTYLFVVSGSHGHIFPAVKLALRLQEAGHRTVFVIPQTYECFVQMQGLDYMAVANAPLPFLSLAEWYLLETNLIQFRVIAEAIEAYRPDRIVTSPLVLAAFAASEIYAIPAVVIGYCEFLFPNLDQTRGRSPKAWRLDAIVQYYNVLRGRLGLPDVEPDIASNPLLGAHYLQRSAPALDDFQPLPPQVSYVGGMYWQPPTLNVPLLHFADRALQEGRRLWYVQVGRLFDKPEKWKLLAAALSAIGDRYLVDIGRADYLGDGAVDRDCMLAYPHVNLSAVADRVTGVLCSGQTSSVIAALLHRKPMLCVPHSDDSRELALRLVGKGVAIAENLEVERGSTLGDKLDAMTRGGFDEALEATAGELERTEAEFWSDRAQAIFPPC